MQGMTRSAWERLMRDQLLDISETHEERAIRHEFNNATAMRTRWTFPTSLLYVLTVLTTCGYGEVNYHYFSPPLHPPP